MLSIKTKQNNNKMKRKNWFDGKRHYAEQIIIIIIMRW